MNVLYVDLNVSSYVRMHVNFSMPKCVSVCLSVCISMWAHMQEYVCECMCVYDGTCVCVKRLRPETAVLGQTQG